MSRQFPIATLVRRRALIAWMAALWLASLLVEGPYLFLRGLGDNLWSGHSVESIERAVFFGDAPTRVLQSSVYAQDVPSIDYFAFLMHGLWFGIPFAYGLILTIYQRSRLLEFMVWQSLLLYVAVPFFMMLPVRPPWMEPGIERVLVVRNYGGYVDIDNNPMAAFPSMHAALPFMTAVFFFLRCERRLWFFGGLVALYAVLVSFSIVYMGEHWVIDVLAGYAIAGITAWLCMSRRMHRLYARIPADPVGRLSRLNDRICAPVSDPAAEPETVPQPEPLPRAA